MIERTSSTPAPWCLIPANDKRYARVKVLNCIADAIEKRL
jgi:polyphosphate kinase 2 (PPK2 family)